MPAKLNLLTLYREAIHEPVQGTARSQGSPELAMDYFDTLIAQEFDAKTDSIREFLGLDSAEDYDQNQIAMQSIPLYCPANVYDTYAKKYRGIYWDPFLTGSAADKDNTEADDRERNELRSSMPYLSVIEVFITPEVIARLDTTSFAEKKQGDCFDCEERPALRVYHQFYRDLHLLMEGFLEEFDMQKNTTEKFIYCIYESVSIGDFAVVVRSSRPETAFKVTTLLRKRACKLQYHSTDSFRKALENKVLEKRASKKQDLENPASKNQNPENQEPDNQEPDTLVLYKTFTIFSLNEAFGKTPPVFGQKTETSDGISNKRDELSLRTAVIPPDEEENIGNSSTQNDCRYVLRGVLSNLYWSNARKNKDPDIMDDGKLRANFRRLHGRYDFTVTLSEQAFRAIHPVLIRYKLDRDISLADKAEDILKGRMLDETEEEICAKLIDYIRNGYISYINERYLFNLDIGKINVTKFNEDIRLLPVKGKLVFTNVYIEDEIQKLKNRIRSEKEKMLRLNTSRGSLDYSMRLLGKLANICSAVNGISDARIYSLVIRRQIEAVLNGIDEYLTYIEQYGDLDIVDPLDSDLKTAIESINSFAQFILESSMQSFQTPTYNLESHVSVEKMLTSYSWFLQSVLVRLEQSRFSAVIRGNTQRYLTVMVPDALDRELSTKAIFFKLNERNKADREKLLTVYCPSFTDMTDFTGSFGVLFHELAHYMRYESRYDRNSMVLRYSSMLLFDQTAANIAEDLQHNILYMTDTAEIQNGLIDCFSEAYKEAICQRNINLYAGGNMNMMLLIQKIKEHYEQFIERIRFLTKLETALTGFLNHSSYIVDRRSKAVMDSMKAIYDEIFRKTEVWHRPEKTLGLLKEGVRLADEYSSLFANAETGDNPTALEETAYIARVLKNILAYLFERDDEEVIDLLDDCANIQLFYRLFYEKLLRYLDSKWGDDTGNRIFSYLFGNTKNKEDGIAILRRYISTFIVHSCTENLELIQQSFAVYREVSSDLFMVKALNLTPFGYLNFFTKQVPMEEYIKDTYIKRFCRVLYAITGEAVRKNETTWRAVFTDIFLGICDFLRHVSVQNTERLQHMADSRYTDSQQKALENVRNGFVLLEKASVRGSTEMPRRKPDEETICNFCYGIYDDVLTPMWDDALSLTQIKYENHRAHREFQKCLSDIKRSIFLCKAFTQITEEFSEQKEAVEKFEILTKDLFIGNRNLEQMYQELRESDLMKYYCGKVAQEYNETGRKCPEAVQGSDIPDCTWKIDFIMDMHYGMIWDYASKILKESY